MAFLTLIAPVITLTYPLDKIKDGKAQAFEVWLKEFIFNVLLQVVHLLLYHLLVTSAADLVTENKVYAVVAIGSLLPAEKFIRKLFGLESSTSMGKMASAFGGAAIMNSINKLGSKGPKGSGGGKSEGNGDKQNIRTANSDAADPYDVFRQGSGGGSSPSGDSQTPSGSKPASQTAGTQNSSAQTGNKTTTTQQTPKRDIKNKPNNGAGWKNLAKRYVLNKNTAKGALRLLAKGAGAATFGTIGLAAGIATGEIENSFAGALGGLAAGSRIGGNLVDGGANLLEGISGGIKGLGDAYGEGVYGKEEYARMKFDKEFKNSEEYKKLTDKYSGKEDDIQQFLNAGITDTKLMEKAFAKNYSTDKAIAYMKMAQASDCPNAVLYSDEKFRTYLTSRKIVDNLTKEVEKIEKQEKEIKEKRKEYEERIIPYEKNTKKKAFLRGILKDDVKFRTFLVKTGEIEDLSEERAKVDAQTQQIRVLRENIVTFK